jgi:hypothetical protein
MEWRPLGLVDSLVSMVGGLALGVALSVAAVWAAQLPG